MGKNIDELLSYKEGDLITLSDIQSQLDANDISQELTIKSVRKYYGPDNIFEYTGYFAEGSNDDLSYMVLIKTSGEEHEIFVYFLETDGQLYDADTSEDECPLWALFDDNIDCLRSSIQATIVTDESKDTYRDVKWDKQTEINGVNFEDNGDEGVCTLGEYYTNDDNEGNNYAFIDLRGKPTDGYIEIWYGCPVQDHEIDFLRII